ncbi:MAG: FecR domain-containing protein [Oceanospirillaceae bacterium]|nr:FecR domain-containing protein [Oceanospirillaceae bacterium]
MKQPMHCIHRLAFCLMCVLLLLPGRAAATDWVYTVVDGDTIWDLSEKHLDHVGRFEQVRRLNGIDDPEHMQPGTRLRIPLEWVRTNAVAAEAAQVQGEVRLLKAGGESRPLRRGDRIELGDRIVTTAGSSVSIRFADDSRLSLKGDSEIRFDHLSAYGDTGMVDTRLNLQRGRLDTQVTPAVGAGSRFDIETPSAISAVRGTDYRAAVREGGDSSSIEVLQGRVAVSGAGRRTQVAGGYGTRVDAGKPPVPPRRLLPAPELEPVPEPVTQPGWRLAWSALPGAIAYRTELAAEPAFETLLWQDRSARPFANLPDVPDGRYHIRVRGIDALGLEGQDRAVGFEVDARPRPPLPLQPADGQVLRGAGPELLWSRSDDARSYRLEIAADESFSSPLLDRRDIAGDRFDAATLSQPGRYYWRLRSQASDGEVGPPGAVRYYEVKPQPPAVDAEVAADEAGLLIASWPAGAPGQRFQAQLANDRYFADRQRDELLEEPQMTIEPVEGQLRYLRVRIVEPDGYRGPWGATQQIAPIPDTGYWWVILVSVIGILAL